MRNIPPKAYLAILVLGLVAAALIGSQVGIATIGIFIIVFALTLGAIGHDDEPHVPG